MKRLSSSSLLCGTLLILTPFIHNIITMGMVAYVLANRTEKDVHLSGSMSDLYGAWCMFIGACLIIAGFVAGLRAEKFERTGAAGSPQTGR